MTAQPIKHVRIISVIEATLFWGHRSALTTVSVVVLAFGEPRPVYKAAPIIRQTGLTHENNDSLAPLTIEPATISIRSPTASSHDGTQFIFKHTQLIKLIFRFSDFPTIP